MNISDSVTINGPGSGLLTVKAYDPSANLGDGTRVFNIDDGTAALINVDIRGLTITGGDVAYGATSLNGGGIRSLENLTVRDSLITGNAAGPGSGSNYYGSASIGRQGGNGGGIWATGSTSIINSQVSYNSTGAGANGADGIPGSAGNGGAGGGGGGIWSTGTLTITGSTFSENRTGSGGAGVLCFSIHLLSEVVAAAGATGPRFGLLEPRILTTALSRQILRGTGALVRLALTIAVQTASAAMAAAFIPPGILPLAPAM